MVRVLITVIIILKKGRPYTDRGCARTWHMLGCKVVLYIQGNRAHVFNTQGTISERQWGIYIMIKASMNVPHRLFPCSVKHDATVIRKMEDYFFHQERTNKQLLYIVLRPVNLMSSQTERRGTGRKFAL